jgi:hypothetical protein
MGRGGFTMKTSMAHCAVSPSQLTFNNKKETAGQWQSLFSVKVFAFVCVFTHDNCVTKTITVIDRRTVVGEDTTNQLMVN